MTADVVVVGTGFAGIAAAAEIRRSGRDVLLVERAGSVGGTWRDNVYPGVACDVPSHLYSLARHPRPEWSGMFAPGAEIRAYLDDVVDAEGLRGRIRFDTSLHGAHWQDDDGAWLLDLGNDTLSARSLVLACGRLAEPRIPAVPGLETFPGELMHTARWQPGTPVSGRRVAVIGTGSSAAQLVPALAAAGAHVLLFQRSAPWVLPKRGRAYTEAERAAFRADPALLARSRAAFIGDETEAFASRSGREPAAHRARAAARAHLREQIPDARMRDILTPAYSFGGKRVVLSDDFYPAIASGAVTVEPSALARIAGRTLISDRGACIDDVDLVVFATGFETARQPYARTIRGEGGRTLDEHWAEGMTSVASTVVTGFPNLFVLNGPNAALAHTSSLLVLEHQAAFVRRALDVRDAAGGVLRVTPDAEHAYTRLIDDRVAGTPWEQTRSWYRDERSGRITLLWPGTAEEFGRMTETALAQFTAAVAAEGGRT